MLFCRLMVHPYGKQDNNLSASAIQTLPLNLMVKNCYCSPRCDDSLTFSVWNRDVTAYPGCPHFLTHINIFYVLLFITNYPCLCKQFRHGLQSFCFLIDLQVCYNCPGIKHLCKIHVLFLLILQLPLPVSPFPSACLVT